MAYELSERSEQPSLESPGASWRALLAPAPPSPQQPQGRGGHGEREAVADGQPEVFVEHPVKHPVLALLLEQRHLIFVVRLGVPCYPPVEHLLTRLERGGLAPLSTHSDQLVERANICPGKLWAAFYLSAWLAAQRAEDAPQAVKPFII